MGYVKKEEMKVTKDGKPYTMVGVYQVIKNSEHMTGIYQWGCLVTSKPKWSQAVKLAKLLSEAYKDGYRDGQEEYDNYIGR